MQQAVVSSSVRIQDRIGYFKRCESRSSRHASPQDQEVTRILFFLGLYFFRMQGSQLTLTAREGIELLKAGVVAIKHGRQGKPHPVRFYLSTNEEFIAWERPGTSVAVKNDRTVAVVAIRSLLVGRESDIFRKATWQHRAGMDTKKNGYPEYSFTLVSTPPLSIYSTPAHRH